MREDNFLSLLKEVAKEQSALGKNRFVPESLSGFANFAASYLWQTISVLALFSTITWNLFKIILK